MLSLCRWAGAVAISGVVLAVVLAAQSGTVRVTAARANIRQTPSDRGTVVTQVPYGTELEVAGVEGGWYRVFVPLGALRVEAYLSRTVAVRVASPGELTTPKAPADAPRVGAGIEIGARLADKTVWLDAIAARAVPLRQRPRTFAELGRISPDDIETAAAGGTSADETSSDVTWIWIAARERAITLPDRHPRFLASYRDAAGVNIADLTPAIVKLVPVSDRWSVVAMARGRVDLDWTPARDLQQQTIKAEVIAAATGTMNVRVTTPLPAGDYALVLRPFFLKRYPGAEVLSDAGIGSVLSVVWPFRISGP